MSASWKASLPMSADDTLPVMATIGHRVQVGVGDPGDEVRGPGPGGAEAHPDLAGGVRVALGGMAPTCSCAHQHVLHLLRVEERVGWAGWPRPDAEHATRTPSASSALARPPSLRSSSLLPSSHSPSRPVRRDPARSSPPARALLAAGLRRAIRFTTSRKARALPSMTSVERAPAAVDAGRVLHLQAHLALGVLAHGHRPGSGSRGAWPRCR